MSKISPTQGQVFSLWFPPNIVILQVTLELRPNKGTV
jgi:hypothetical protein